MAHAGRWEVERERIADGLAVVTGGGARSARARLQCAAAAGLRALVRRRCSSAGVRRRLHVERRVRTRAHANLLWSSAE